MSAAAPFRWPSSWSDASAVDLLRGTVVDLILIPEDAAFDRVRARARELGIATASSAPEGVTIVQGAWPGVKASRGGGNEAAAGPTGAAWVDSNGWLVRLTRALHPELRVWVDAPPNAGAVIAPAAYALAIADAAAHGGRWILTLDETLAKQVTPESPAWKQMLAASAWFAARPAWADYRAAAVVGVVSDFVGTNEFMGQELLNLLARAGQQYRIVLKQRPDFTGLRAILYADGEAPSDTLHKQATAFVKAGGLLITAPVWGVVAGRPMPEEHPRYSIHALGKGRIASAHRAPEDPWQVANDSVVLVSHRHDLVRCFNSGSFGAYYTLAPDRRKAVVHLFFYANRGPSEASVRVAGSFRGARISTIDQAEPQPVPAGFSKDAVEVHLPQVPPYVALELTV